MQSRKKKQNSAGLFEYSYLATAASSSPAMMDGDGGFHGLRRRSSGVLQRLGCRTSGRALGATVLLSTSTGLRRRPLVVVVEWALLGSLRWLLCFEDLKQGEEEVTWCCGVGRGFSGLESLELAGGWVLWAVAGSRPRRRVAVRGGPTSSGCL